MGKVKDRGKEPAKGGDQSKKKDKASKDNAAAEAAAAAAAEIAAFQDPMPEGTDAGRERPQPRRQSAKGGRAQPESGDDLETSDDDGNEGPVLAAQSRHVNTDLARQCAELQRALAAAEVTIPSGRVLMHLMVFFFW